MARRHLHHPHSTVHECAHCFQTYSSKHLIKTICMWSWSGEGNLSQVSVFHDQKGAPLAQLVECQT